jgi:hypothetical protein
MKKFPFNEAGFIALQEELYQLSDDLLTAQAKQIETTFENWVMTNFELSQSQIDFMKNLDQRYLGFMASQTSFAVGNRLPVSLAKEDPPASTDEQGKIVYTKSSLTASNAQPTGFVAGGDLLFMITYKR